MAHDLEMTTSLLARTPSALDALLRDLPEAWTRGTEGEGTWSPFDVIGHLITGERADWMVRARLILQFGESRPFEKFTREAHFQENQGRSLGGLLDELATLRATNLHELFSLKLTQADLGRTGRHPALGIVTLSQLLATWAAHDLSHLHQISRVMAFQYRDAVGPWTAYLGVMQCAGHSA